MFEKILVEGKDILDYIPQKPPMVMVDSFYGIQESYSFSGLRIELENIFCEKGVFKEPGLIEHIAQSAALRIGYICKQKQMEVPEGFIAVIKNFKINRLPVVGEKLNTGIKVEYDFGDSSVISARSMVNDEIISECEMKIFLNKK
jgi:hypothetical protein